jgi:hypothetical protein
MDIAERNHLRDEANLPLLDVATELARIETTTVEAEFEIEWQRRRPEFENWIRGGQGWLSKMGRCSFARQIVRKEMPKRYNHIGDR